MTTRSLLRQDLAGAAAIADRDWRLFLSYRMELLMTVASAAAMVIGLSFMDRVVGESPAMGPYAGSYFEFAIIGIVFIALVDVGLDTFGGSLSAEQRAGTLEMLLVSPTRLPALLAGMLLFPLSSVIVSLGVYLATAVLFLGARFEPAGILSALLVLSLTLVAFSGVGAMSAAVIIITKRGDPIGAVAAQAATVLGGALFPVSVLPEWLAFIARLFPPYHGLAAMRAVLIEGASMADIGSELLILTVFALALLPAGLWMLSRALRLARQLGTLSTY